MTEADIVYEVGSFWVGRERGAYVVYRVGLTHSVSDSAYERSSDGLSIAKARCDYLARKNLAAVDEIEPVEVDMLTDAAE